MGSKHLIRDTYAVSSETIDSILLLGTAVIAFGVVTATILPIPFPSETPHVDLSAYIRGDYVFIEHMGGEPLDFSKTEVSVSIGDTPKPKPSLHEINNNGLWECGEFLQYYYNTTDIVSVLVVDTVSNTVLLQGNLRRGETPWIGAPPPILVSSLRTDTVDEDLTAYALPVQGFDAHTFIYNWKRNGASIAQLLMPFDTQSLSSTRDYSGNGYNGNVYGATWISNGMVGGAYYFDGKNDYISISLPEVFNNLYTNNFTISLWIKSEDITTNTSQQECILEAYYDENNFVQLFQYESAIQFGVCVNGDKKAVKTSSLQSNTWYHITATWSTLYDSLTIYLNGQPSTSGGSRDYQNGNTRLLSLGQKTNKSDGFSGYIDELQIYPYLRSQEQIYQDYLDTKDGLTDHRTIVSRETSLGETWSCVITPNNANQDGDVEESDNLIITSYGGGAP